MLSRRENSECRLWAEFLKWVLKFLSLPAKVMSWVARSQKLSKIYWSKSPYSQKAWECPIQGKGTWLQDGQEGQGVEQPKASQSFTGWEWPSDGTSSPASSSLSSPGCASSRELGWKPNVSTKQPTSNFPIPRYLALGNQMSMLGPEFAIITNAISVVHS